MKLFILSFESTDEALGQSAVILASNEDEAWEIFADLVRDEADMLREKAGAKVQEFATDTPMMVLSMFDTEERDLESEVE